MDNKVKMRKSMNISYIDAIPAILYYMVGGGYAPNMNGFTYEITYRCNLRCKMCYLWGEKSASDTERKIRSGKELTLEDLKKNLIPPLKEMKVKRIQITGGEPLLRNDIFELIHLFKSHGFNCRLNTNLGVHTEKIYELLKTGIDSIAVSIDGPEKIHDELRGHSGTYNKTIKALELINEYKELKPFVRLNCLISSLNMGYVADILDIGKEVGVDMVSYQFLEWVTKKQIEKTNALIGLKADVSHIPETYPQFLKVDSSLLLRQIEVTCKKSKELDIPVYFEPLYLPIKKQEIEKYFSDEAFHRISKCLYPFMQTRMDPYGNIYPCLPLRIGNIKEQNLKVLWNSELYRNFRKKLKKGIFPACNKCCSLGTSELKYLFSIH